MKYPEEAYKYLETEHIRLLMEGNRIPSIEDRVMEAFMAGVKSVKKTKPFLEVVSNKKSHNITEVGTINFPRFNE